MLYANQAQYLSQYVTKLVYNIQYYSQLPSLVANRVASWTTASNFSFKY